MEKSLKRLFLYPVLGLLFFPAALRGQTATVGSKVAPVEIRDTKNEPMMLPELGKKVLLIFYVDPDHGNQNKEFRENLEKNRIESDNIFSFGIVNLKDAPMLPNMIVRGMVRSTVKRTGADIYTDPDHLLRDAWKLGDVNDKFTILIVNKECEIVYLSKGELTESQIKQFHEVIDRYK